MKSMNSNVKSSGNRMENTQDLILKRRLLIEYQQAASQSEALLKKRIFSPFKGSNKTERIHQWIRGNYFK